MMKQMAPGLVTFYDIQSAYRSGLSFDNWSPCQAAHLGRNSEFQCTNIPPYI